MEPSSFPFGQNRKSTYRHFVAQANLSTVNCPAGMVPIIRGRKLGQIIVQNIDQVSNKHIEHEVSFQYFYFQNGIVITGLLPY